MPLVNAPQIERCQQSTGYLYRQERILPDPEAQERIALKGEAIKYQELGYNSIGDDGR